MATVSAVATVFLLLVSGTAAQAPTLEQLQQIFDLLAAQHGGGSSATVGQGLLPRPEAPFPVAAVVSSDSASQPLFPQNSVLPQQQNPAATSGSQASGPGIQAIPPAPPTPTGQQASQAQAPTQPFGPSIPAPGTGQSSSALGSGQQNQHNRPSRPNQPTQGHQSSSAGSPGVAILFPE